MKHPEITQLELLNAIERPVVRIVERAILEGEEVRGYCDGETITLGLHKHKQTAYAHDLTLTFIHELMHFLRPTASHRWVKRREMLWWADDKVRAAAAIRLLNARLFEEAPRAA